MNKNESPSSKIALRLNHRHPAVFPCVWLRGRSPGLQDLADRLPKCKDSVACVVNPRLLTVAGAAQAL